MMNWIWIMGSLCGLALIATISSLIIFAKTAVKEQYEKETNQKDQTRTKEKADQSSQTPQAEEAEFPGQGDPE
jgi:sortase (surface protein transpeptidase)